MTPATADPVEKAKRLIDRSISRELRDPREICLAIAQTVEHEWKDLDKPFVDSWPMNGAGKPEEFQEAELVASIGEGLIARIDRFEFLNRFDIGYLYRYAESWEKDGRTVLGTLKKNTGLVKFYSQHAYEMQINWLLWMKATPWQKVALVYHELHHADQGEGLAPAMQGHHIECFFDELEIFGTETYQDWQRLAEASRVGEKVDVQYHIGFDS